MGKRLVRCCICGRIADVEKNAEPYKKGICCVKCYEEQVIPCKQWELEKKRRSER